MRIGSYSFEEFRSLAENFHGYAAPGLLLGAFMVEKAKAALPQGTLFEAVVETVKCLPDAVQLLTLCSTGNQRLKVRNLGKYAVTLFDKHTGEGARVSIDPVLLEKWPELYAWFFKKKEKHEQDSAKLEEEIRLAGDSVCKIEHVRVKKDNIGAKHMGQAAICPLCGEAYPAENGPICRGCQGDAPYERLSGSLQANAADPAINVVPLEEAVGRIAAHDMTRIVPGQFKGPEFRAGQRLETGDICRLQKIGKFNVAVLAENSTADSDTDAVHENRAAEAFAQKMAGQGIVFSLPPKEGKIDFRAERDGLFCVDVEKLRRFNLVPDVMAASRQDATVVKKNAAVAGTRAIPLFLSRKNFELAFATLGEEPLFRVLPMRRAKAGILVTGTEVFRGLIEDSFIPVISAKLLALDCEITATAIAPDDAQIIGDEARAMFARGIDLLITTGGLSVDPDDVTRKALLSCGLHDVVHGVPVLPGTMTFFGLAEYEGREIQVVGTPACALFSKTTFFDLLLPRLLAGRNLTRGEAASMGDGGYCLSCRICSWPKCSFGK